MSEGRDAEFQKQLKAWHGFTRLIRYTAAAVAVVLIGLAAAFL